MLKHLGHRKRHALTRTFQTACDASGQQPASVVVQSDTFAGLLQATTHYVDSKRCKSAVERDAVLRPLLAEQQTILTRSWNAGACGPREMTALVCAHLASPPMRTELEAHTLLALQGLVKDPGCPLANQRNAVDFTLTLLRQQEGAPPSTLTGLELLLHALQNQENGFAVLQRCQTLTAFLRRGDVGGPAGAGPLIRAYLTSHAWAITAALQDVHKEIIARKTDVDFLTDTARSLAAVREALPAQLPAWATGLLAWRPDGDRIQALEAVLSRLPERLGESRAVLRRVREMEGPAEGDAACARLLFAREAPGEAAQLETLVQRLLDDPTGANATLCNVHGGVDAQLAMLSDVMARLGQHGPALHAMVARDGAPDASESVLQAWRDRFAVLEVDAWPEATRTLFKRWCLVNSPNPDFLRVFPAELRCPISNAVCVDPVMGPDGTTYARRAWERQQAATERTLTATPLVRAIVEALATTEQTMAQVLDTHAACAFTGSRLREPVVLADGLVYEKAFATTWLHTQTTSPVTGTALAHRQTMPHRMLAALLRNADHQSPHAAYVPIREVHFASPVRRPYEGWVQTALDGFNADYYALLERANELHERVRNTAVGAGASDLASLCTRLDNLGLVKPPTCPVNSQALSHEQAMSLQGYTGSSYIPINHALRCAAITGEACDDATANILRKLVERSSLAEDATLYRGVIANSGSVLFTVQPGDIIYEPGFSSTSFERAVAEGFGGATSILYIIAYKAPQAALEVGGAGYGFSDCGEAEVLLPPDTRFRVHATSWEVGLFVLHVSIV